MNAVIILSLVALLVVGVEREARREYRLLVTQVNEGLASLARDLGLQILDSGQSPLKDSSEARFAYLGGVYQGISLSVSVDSTADDVLQTKLTLAWTSRRENSSRLEIAHFAKLNRVKAYAREGALLLYICEPFSRGFWRRPLLSLDRVPEVDRTRLLFVLDQAAALVRSLG